MGLPYRTRRPTANRCSSFDTTFVGNRFQGGKFDVLYSVNETCKQLSTGRTLAYKLMASGELEVVKIRGRTLITKASLTKLIETKRAA